MLQLPDLFQHKTVQIDPKLNIKICYCIKMPQKSLDHNCQNQLKDKPVQTVLGWSSF